MPWRTCVLAVLFFCQLGPINLQYSALSDEVPEQWGHLGNLSKPSLDLPAGEQEYGRISINQTMFCGVPICSPA